jgi:hypothetical protein
MSSSFRFAVFAVVSLISSLAIAGCDVRFEHSPTEKTSLSPSAELEGVWSIQSEDAKDRIYLVARAMQNQELSLLYVEAKENGEFDTIQLRASAFVVNGEHFFSARTIAPKVQPGQRPEEPIQFLVARYREQGSELELFVLTQETAKSAIRDGKLGGQCKESTITNDCSISSSASEVLKFLSRAENLQLFDKHFLLHRLESQSGAKP